MMTALRAVPIPSSWRYRAGSGSPISMRVPIPNGRDAGISFPQEPQAAHDPHDRSLGACHVVEPDGVVARRATGLVRARERREEQPARKQTGGVIAGRLRSV